MGIFVFVDFRFLPRILSCLFTFHVLVIPVLPVQNYRCTFTLLIKIVKFQFVLLLPLFNMLLHPPENFLDTPGEPPVPWIRWQKIFKNYFTASGFDDSEKVPDTRQVAIALHCLGIEGQRMYYATITEQAKNITELFNQLDSLFGQVNLAAERNKFRCRKQRQDESIRMYVASLRELASNCNFKTFEDEMIRDQIIEHSYNPRIKQKLVSKTYSLKECIQIAQELEEGIKAAAQIDKQPTESHSVHYASSQCWGPGNSMKPKSSMPTNIKTSSFPVRTQAPKNFTTPRGRSCNRCGSTQHLANFSQCPARKAQCRVCKKIGHYGKICKSRSNQQVGLVDTYMCDDANEHNDPPLGSDTREHIQILYVNASQTHYMYKTIHVNGKPVSLIVDTVATISLLNYESYVSDFQNCKLLPPDIKLVMFNGQNIDTKGYFVANAQHNDKIVQCKFYVTKQGCNILGLDLFKSLNLSVSAENVHFLKSDCILDNHLYSEMFSGIGTVKGFQHKCELLPNASPVVHKQRPVPFAMIPLVEQEVEKLLSAKIIEKVEHSRWVSPVVLARKPNGSLRLCVDLRSVNKNIVPV